MGRDYRYPQQGPSSPKETVQQAAAAVVVIPMIIVTTVGNKISKWWNGR